MNPLFLAFVSLLVVLASWCGWNAYRIGVQGRTDLVRLGSRALPGADRLKSQFSWLFLLQAVAYLAAAGAVLATGSMQIPVWLCLVVAAGLALRRSILIRGLEQFAQNTNADA